MILVTGATGYIGGRLIPRLLEAGKEVRALVRDPSRVEGRPWVADVEVVTGDVLEPASLPAALDGVDQAYYLIHSMGGRGDFESTDREGAKNFVAAGQGLRHVVYLGGFLPEGDEASKHLASRAEVGAILRDALPATEFRAGPIIGSGSASFEMVRYLTERLPVMIAPKWVLNNVQPIGIRDMLAYLLAALDKEPVGVVDVGGEVLTFRQMMEGFAEVRGLKRTILPVPVLAPTLAALWVGLVTPIPNRLAVPLVQGMTQSLTADTARAREVFPDIHPSPYKAAVARALDRTEEGRIETHWSGALRDGAAYELTDWAGMIRETRVRKVGAPPDRVFREFSRLGGKRGWPAWNWAWKFRGWIDRLVGGPGLRRGRRHPEELLPGEAVDFWRVEAVEKNRSLRLRAEMKVPGKAWLQYDVRPEGDGSLLTQTAVFAPKGFWGNTYWYALYPIHRWIFSDLAGAIARASEEGEESGEDQAG